MKKLLILVAIMTSLNFAASEPRTHDGGFLSIAIGMGYQSIDFVPDDREEVTHNVAGLATDIAFKLGGKVSYNTLLHLTLAGTTKTGTTNYGDDRDYQNIRVNMALFGLGATHYFENNIFITASCGISQFHANDDIAVFSAIVQSNTSQDINTGFGFQVGGGKEWWVSDNWGIGASAALLYGFASNLADARESSLGITLRLSATWN